MGKLDTPASCFAVSDDILDFTLDCDGEGEKGDRKTILKGATYTAAFGHGTRGGSVPDLAAEEELEWLSNKDAFPSVETCFGILSDNPQLVSNHQKSPVSVLENTNANSNNGGGSALVVPTNIPLQARRSRRGRKRKANYGESSSSVFPPDLTSGSGIVRRRCFHCQVDTTPQWRAGPMGPKTLCNACGVRYKSGRLLPEYRPANSPTFSKDLNSNSHRRVVEMRNRKQVSPGGNF